MKWSSPLWFQNLTSITPATGFPGILCHFLFSSGVKQTRYTYSHTRDILPPPRITITRFKTRIFQHFQSETFHSLPQALRINLPLVARRQSQAPDRTFPTVAMCYHSASGQTGRWLYYYNRVLPPERLRTDWFTPTGGHATPQPHSLQLLIGWPLFKQYLWSLNVCRQWDSSSHWTTSDPIHLLLAGATLWLRN